MITSRKEDALREAAAFIGGGASYIAGNAGDTDFAQKCVSATLEQFGKIDIFVNNAATNPYSGPTLEVSESQFDKTFQVNLRGPLFWCSQVWSQHMKDNPGVIINIASGAGMRGSPMTGPYAASKAGMINLTLTLALELAERDIRVNTVSPGPIATEAFLEVLGIAADLDAIASTIPLRRLGTPDDIGAAVLYLASPASSWVTGQNILVAGGRTERSYQYGGREKKK